MPNMHKVGTVATKVKMANNVGSVTYHSTKVVEWDANKIILFTNGWNTVTTKNRMNQASNQFGLGFSVSQKNGVWFVGFKGEKLPMGDYIELKR